MDLPLFDAELGGPARHPFVEDYLGCSPDACPARYRAASPVDRVDPTDPPMLIANGTREIVPLEQARAMAARLAAARIPHRLLVVPSARHAGAYEQAAWPGTVSFLRRYLR
jgi:acetyl esterase/lipase